MSKPIYTDSNICIEPTYCTPPKNFEKSGEFPFTRGVHKEMYRNRLWTMRQYAGFSTAKESNERYHYLLSQGVSGLSIAFDLPTQIGYDSDDPLAEGEVGKVGVAIDSMQDMEELFKGIELEKISTSMTINSTAFILLAMYVAKAKQQNADLTKLSGTIQNDILKEYAARGTYVYPPIPSMKIITDIFEWCSEHLPKWNTISISGYHIREAGSTAAEEIAFTLANGKEYVKAAMSKGLPIDVFGSRLSFFFNVHNHFFEEVAKFRAARRIWAKLMKSLGATNPKAMMLRFHAQTGGSTLTAQQLYNNIVRVAIQSMAATMGGTQSLHTNGYDEAIGLPTEEAVTVALRTQQIIAFESGIPDSADPLGGSYFVENLTDQLEEKALGIMKKIDDMGGSVAVIEKGYMQEQIAQSAYEYQKKIEKKEKIIVGLNKFHVDEEKKAPLFKVDDSIRDVQIQKLQTLKNNRDKDMVTKCLKDLQSTVKEDRNIMPHVLACVENHCTLGEIAGELRKIYGEYKA